MSENMQPPLFEMDPAPRKHIQDRYNPDINQPVAEPVSTDKMAEANDTRNLPKGGAIKGLKAVIKADMAEAEKEIDRTAHDGAGGNETTIRAKVIDNARPTHARAPGTPASHPPKGRDIDIRTLSPNEKMKRDEPPEHIRREMGRN
jgi:hypothetical protein